MTAGSTRAATSGDERPHDLSIMNIGCSSSNSNSDNTTVVSENDLITQTHTKSTAGPPSPLPLPQTDTQRPSAKSPEHCFEMDESAVSTRGGVTGGSIRSFISATGTGSWSLRKRGTLTGAARHTAGLILLLCVVMLWTLSNFLGSSIFANNEYAKPFFLTYLNTSVFVFAMIPTWIKWIFKRWRAGTLWIDTKKILSGLGFKSLVHRGMTDPLLQGEFSRVSETEAFLKPNRGPASSAEPPSRSNTSADSIEESSEKYLGLIPTARLSLIFCLFWFGANYFAMSCLQYTTVASMTILTSTSSIWTLLIGAFSRTEKFTWRKLCGVLASVTGIIIISRADMSSPSVPATTDPTPSANLTETVTRLTARALEEFPDKSAGELAIGDAQALLSAIVYGFYTITLKKSTIKAAPLELHMPTFFGLVGVCNIIILLPLFPFLHFTGIETFQLPPTKHIWGVMIVNSISGFASDIMWAYAMVLTSPLVVTVGLSLGIPVSLLGEVFVQDRYEGWIYWVGAMIVVASFVFVEREEVKEVGERDEVEEVRIVEAGGPSESGNFRNDVSGIDAGAGANVSLQDARISSDLSDLIETDDDDDDHDKTYVHGKTIERNITSRR